MLFNSAIFLLLFVMVYALYWHLPLRGKQNLIILASLLFYGWYSVPFLLLFLALIVVNYHASMRLIRRPGQRALFWSVLAIDVGLLAFFKYFYLFAETIGRIIGSDYIASLRHNWLQDHDFSIALPIAISFYTFQILAFLIDSYKGRITETVEPRKFYLFILFFPQFVAGPIMRAEDFIPQIDRPNADRDRIINGGLLILQGVVKKVLIADQIGALTGEIWHDPARFDAVFLVLVMPAFLVQIYCDFSGYTDIARGLALALGYNIPENFRGPFLSRSMQELWQRWHVTLSTWLRDYIYFPLGGSRLGEWRTNINLLATMALGGLWHGANWNMLFWGLYIGVVLVIERSLSKKGIRILPQLAIFTPVRVAWTFALFSLSTAFFAAPDIARTGQLLGGILEWQRGDVPRGGDTILALTIFGYLFNVPQYHQSWKSWLNRHFWLRVALGTVAFFVIGYLVLLFGDVSGSFIYFQF